MRTKEQQGRQEKRYSSEGQTKIVPGALGVSEHSVDLGVLAVISSEFNTGSSSRTHTK
jgi:hypothetical protein